MLDLKTDFYYKRSGVTKISLGWKLICEKVLKKYFERGLKNFTIDKADFNH
jgi:hypothetical protein